MSDNKKNIGFLRIALAFLFLFNPNISIVDPLPDIIGYLLICSVLSKLAYLNETLGRASELFSKMVLLDGAKLLSVLFVFGLSFGDEQNTMLLLIVFAFGVLELFMLIPAYKQLFEGLIQLGYKYENSSIMARKGNSRKNVTEKASSFTLFFVIFKVAACVLPELSVLATQTSDVAASYVNLYDFVGLLRGFAIIVCLVFGIIWLVRMMKYFRMLNKDTALVTALSNEYNTNVLPRKGIFAQKRIRLAFLFIGAFALLCADFRLDGVNVIPDFLSALSLIAAILLLKKYLPSFKKHLACASLYGVVSVLYFIVETAFFDRYYLGAVIRDNGAYNLYMIMLSISVIKTVTFVMSAFYSIKLFRTVIDEHTGFSVSGLPYGVSDRIHALHKELNRKMTVPIAAAILASVVDVFCNFSARIISFTMLINNASVVIFFVTICYAANEIYEEVKAKYILE